MGTQWWHIHTSHRWHIHIGQIKLYNSFILLFTCSRSSHFFTPAHDSAPAHQIFGPLRSCSNVSSSKLEKWTDFHSTYMAYLCPLTIRANFTILQITTRHSQTSHPVWPCRSWLHVSPNGPLRSNLTSFIKPEVHNLSQRCQRRTEPRPQGIFIPNFVKIGPAVPHYARGQTDRQRNRHTDRQTGWSQYSAPIPGRSSNYIIRNWESFESFLFISDAGLRLSYSRQRKETPRAGQILAKYWRR